MFCFCFRFKEIFLEDIDSMFTSGNIPDLFDVDELDSLLMELKNDAMMENISDEKSELNKYLINVNRIAFSFLYCEALC